MKLELKDETRQVYKVGKKPKAYMKIFALYPAEKYQIDLIELGSTARYRHVKFLLTCIDVYSRKAGIWTLTSKKPDKVLDAFKKLIEFYYDGVYPTTLQSDSGSEFKGVFGKFLKVKGIEHFTIISRKEHQGQGLIERFNYTISRMIAKYIYDNENKNFLEFLPYLMEAYNSSEHSGVSGIPNMIFDGKDIPEDSNVRRDVKIFYEDDKVRVKIPRETFTKGRVQRYTPEVFTVKEKEGNRYIIEDSDGKKQTVLYSNLLKV